MLFPFLAAFSTSQWRVALLGIAERRIHVRFGQKERRERNAKPLPVNIQTIGDWIHVKRTEKNLTSGHVAAKMGIAQSVVRSWEIGINEPDSLQLAVLGAIFGSKPTFSGS